MEFGNCYEYGCYYNDLEVNDGGVGRFREEELIKLRDDRDGILYGDINWID